MIFGKRVDGREVEAVSLRRGRLEVTVLTLGALIQDLRVEGRPVVLGFDSLAPYLDRSPYFGVVAGRCANRIAGGRFVLDGREHRLPVNEQSGHHLHGGPDGFSQRLWSLAGHSDEEVRLTLASPDGDQGYPGNVEISCRYELCGEDTLRIELAGRTDQPTLLNLATHSYFNLAGTGDILGHRLQIAADRYLPVDAGLIPTGEIRDVSGTPFDFRALRAVGEVIPDGTADGAAPRLLDHNFCLCAQALDTPRKVARLEAADGSLALEIATTEPGLQVYDGSGIAAGLAGAGGRRYGPHAGLCLEPQRWPDAINQQGFAGAVLRPGETYGQITEYRFPLTS